MTLMNDNPCIECKAPVILDADQLKMKAELDAALGQTTNMICDNCCVVTIVDED